MVSSEENLNKLHNDIIDTIKSTGVMTVTEDMIETELQNRIAAAVATP